MVILITTNTTDAKGDGKQVQINENQDFSYEAIGISIGTLK